MFPLSIGPATLFTARQFPSILGGYTEIAALGSVPMSRWVADDAIR